jgi:hypothetical protein
MTVSRSIAAAVALLALAGCPPPSQPPSPPASTDAGQSCHRDGVDQCASGGCPCTTPAQCCGGACVDHVCTCQPLGGPCGLDVACCNLHCDPSAHVCAADGK